ncbi:PIN domain-containing protein [Pseudoalteromonas sp. SR41-1]|uniref:PIN domain-containing protein n=1 Tax=Pseudoalteromonas sp. SR41-1 TaxID=2760952 RepID=UPI0016033139|nr:PIN domain-containing protein [Pseudoalteromonas sp. SR41-1]MBB1281698.1 DUF4935 domain-containing protein [Pseudoalteromonas sp. SR41-1]
MAIKHVFIDSCAYRNLGFDTFSNQAFKQLKKYCEMSHCQLYITSIITKEVEGILEVMENDALNLIGKLKGKTKLLSPSIDEQYEMLKSNIEGKYSEYFTNFLTTVNCIEVPITNIDETELLDMYFLQKPPFKGKSGNKSKSEFPDAINILALKEYMNQRDSIVEEWHLVSHDSDFGSLEYSEKEIFTYKTLKDLMTAINKENDSKVGQVIEFLKGNVTKNKLITYVENFFEDVCENSLNLLEIQEWNRGILDLEMHSANIEVINIAVIEKDLDEPIAVIEYEVVLTLDAGFEYMRRDCQTTLVLEQVVQLDCYVDYYEVSNRNIEYSLKNIVHKFYN